MKPDFILRRQCDRLKISRKKSRLNFKQIAELAEKLTGSSKGFSKSQILDDERYDNRVNDLSKLVTYSLIYKTSLIWLIEFKGSPDMDMQQNNDLMIIEELLAAASPEQLTAYRTILEVVSGEFSRTSDVA
jgi:hypothetical protein